mgnify:CR=1 FL=1
MASEITDVKATLHRVPIDVPLLKEPIVTSVLFAAVETDHGVTGYGLTRGSQRFAMQRIHQPRGRHRSCAGRIRCETERIWNQLTKQFNARAQTGMWSSAVSAIDIALWDIRGKHYKEPVWRLLGGAQNPVQAYVTFGLKQYSKRTIGRSRRSNSSSPGRDTFQDGRRRRSENPKLDAERVTSRAPCGRRRS